MSGPPTIAEMRAALRVLDQIAPRCQDDEPVALAIQCAHMGILTASAVLWGVLLSEVASPLPDVKSDAALRHLYAIRLLAALDPEAAPADPAP